MFWAEVMRKDVVTQQLSQVGNCAIAWLPEMLVEQNRLTNSVGAAVESRGNDTIKVVEVTNRLFAGMAKLAVESREESLKLVENVD